MAKIDIPSSGEPEPKPEPNPRLGGNDDLTNVDPEANRRKIHRILLATGLGSAAILAGLGGYIVHSATDGGESTRPKEVKDKITQTAPVGSAGLSISELLNASPHPFVMSDMLNPTDLSHSDTMLSFDRAEYDVTCGTPAGPEPPIHAVTYGLQGVRLATLRDPSGYSIYTPLSMTAYDKAALDRYRAVEITNPPHVRVSPSRPGLGLKVGRMLCAKQGEQVDSVVQTSGRRLISPTSFSNYQPGPSGYSGYSLPNFSFDANWSPTPDNILHKFILLNIGMMVVGLVGAAKGDKGKGARNLSVGFFKLEGKALRGVARATMRGGKLAAEGTRTAPRGWAGEESPPIIGTDGLRIEQERIDAESVKAKVEGKDWAETTLDEQEAARMQRESGRSSGDN